MYIEIENTNIEKNDFPNKNDSSARWYTANQNALFFREGEKHPDKFELVLSFSSSQTEQNAAIALKPGKYTFSDSAYYIDNRNHLQLDANRLVQAG